VKRASPAGKDSGWPIRSQSDIGYRPAFYIRGGETKMLHYSLVFLVIALIAAVLGFGGIAGAAAGIAKILFVVFLVVWLITFITGRRSV
jgi:uncharacterized membrane protein YtjA (UPF0391 family)